MARLIANIRVQSSEVVKSMGSGTALPVLNVQRHQLPGNHGQVAQLLYASVSSFIKGGLNSAWHRISCNQCYHFPSSSCTQLLLIHHISACSSGKPFWIPLRRATLSLIVSHSTVYLSLAQLQFYNFYIIILLHLFPHYFISSRKKQISLYPQTLVQCLVSGRHSINK